MKELSVNVFATFEVDTTKQIAEIINSLSGKDIERVNIFNCSVAQSIDQAIQNGLCSFD